MTFTMFMPLLYVFIKISFIYNFFEFYQKGEMQMNGLKKGLIYKAVTGMVVLVAKLINFAEKYKDE